MACGGSGSGNLNCVCDILAEYVREQNAVSPAEEAACENCLSLSPVAPITTDDTFVLMLTTKENTLLYDFYTANNNTFVTPYFRVQDVDENTGCATLMLLQPNNQNDIPVDGKNTCCVEFADIDLAGITFEATGVCITVDCDCLCKVRCLGTANLF